VESSAGYRYSSLEFTEVFFDDFAGFSGGDRRRFLRALRLLDGNERHRSLRVHDLQGPLAGVWPASASDDLRITFERLHGGRKLLLTCSRHYQR
jgi:hypothetical protein